VVEAIRQGDIPGVQLRVRRELAAPPEAVRPCLAEADRLAGWLADEVELDARGGVELRTGFEGGRLVERGATLERTADRWRLSFRRLDAGWGVETTLALEAAPHPAGCEVAVFQQGFQRLPLSIGLTEWEFYRRRWRAACDRLATLVES